MTLLHQPYYPFEAGLELETRTETFFPLFLAVFHSNRFFESNSVDTTFFFFCITFLLFM